MVVKSEILCASGHLYLISSIQFYVRMFYVRTDRCVGDANKRYFPVNHVGLCEIDNGPLFTERKTRESWEDISLLA